MPRRVDDDLLPLERPGRGSARRAPASRACRAATVRGRRASRAACGPRGPSQNGQRLELLLGRRLELGAARARPSARGPARSRRSRPESGSSRSSASASGSLALRCCSRNGVIRSIGSREDDRRRPRGADLEQRLQVAQLERDRVLARSRSPRPSAARRPGTRPRRRSPSRAARARPRPGGPSRAACPAGISTSLTSTIETLIPQGEVASSMISCRIALILSRSERSSSSRCWPSTRPQRRLRDLRGRDHEVLDLHDRVLRVDDPEVGDRVHAHRDVVLRDHLLRRDVQRDRPQVDLAPSGRRSGSAGRGPAPSARAAAGRAGRSTPRSYSRATLIAASRNSRTRNGDDDERRSARRSRVPDPTPRSLPSGSTSSTRPRRRPSTRTLLARARAARRRPSRACQSSPWTKTSPSRRACADLADDHLRPDRRPAGAGPARPSPARRPRSRRARARRPRARHGSETWYGAGAGRRASASRRRSAISPRAVSAPWLTTSASIDEKRGAEDQEQRARPS